MRYLPVLIVITLITWAICSPVGAQPLVIGKICCTNAGSCVLPNYDTLGAPCTCTGPWGTDPGRVCR